MKLDKDLHELFELFRSNGLALTPDDFFADDRVIQLGRAPNRVDLLTRLSGVAFTDAWQRRPWCCSSCLLLGRRRVHYAPRNSTLPWH